MVQAAETGELSSEWGGHLRAITTLSYPDDRSIYQFTDTDTYFDRQGELRIKHQLFMGKQWILETHYEMLGQEGDTLKNNNRLRTLLPATMATRLIGNTGINDDRRFFNLTHSLVDGVDDLLLHRLDRLNITYNAASATVRIGRQALTWGNGLLFNPMDLFNPFAPTTIQRDYKIGDDMLHFQAPINDGELQLLFLPRRDTVSGKVDGDQSSLAGKWHLPLSRVEFDLMAAYHYEDLILAAGASGYLGGTAWRSDIIYTRLNDGTGPNDYIQFVANMDYAWQWWGKPFYGLLEFYYNGLGESRDYACALTDPAISQRVDRGELYALGRTYLAGRLNITLHPLVQTGVTAIVNLADPSAILQPQLVWDVATNLQLIVGADFGLGDEPSEFGGFDITVGANTIKASPTQSRYLWLTYYF